VARSFFYGVDGSLRVFPDGDAEPHAATRDEWGEAAHALIPNLDGCPVALGHGWIGVPPEDR
jgi:hypothetical protein